MGDITNATNLRTYVIMVSRIDAYVQCVNVDHM